MTKSAGTQTKQDTSYILRILWAGWAIGKGRQPTIDDIRSSKGLMLAMSKNFLPELQKKTNKKGKSHETNRQQVSTQSD
jgi:hypothetical protein